MNKIVATIYTSRDNAVVFKRMANDNGWLIATERYSGDDVLLEFEVVEKRSEAIVPLSNGDTISVDMYRLNHCL